jgi:hypothetical protein
MWKRQERGLFGSRMPPGQPILAAFTPKRIGIAFPALTPSSQEPLHRANIDSPGTVGILAFVEPHGFHL